MGLSRPQLHVQYDDDWVVINQTPVVASPNVMLSFGDIHLKAEVEVNAPLSIYLHEEDGCTNIMVNTQRIFQFLLPSTGFEPAQWDVFIRWLPSRLKAKNNVLLQLKEDSTGQIDFTAVRYLVLQQCDWIEQLSDFANLEQLESLSILNCASLKRIQSLDRALNLKNLEIRWCGSLKWLPDFSSLQALEQLRIQWCSKLEAVPNLAGHPSLKILHISACNALGSLPTLKGSHQLHTLYVSWFRNTPYFPELEDLPGLRVLNLQSCSGLEYLPKISDLRALYQLNISDCQDLMSIEQLEELPSLKVLEANGCTKFKNSSFLRSLSFSRFCWGAVSISVRLKAWVFKQSFKVCISVVRASNNSKALRSLNSLSTSTSVIVSH